MGIVSIDETRSGMLAMKALDYRSIRQDMISSNIANVDTPFYRPRDISFNSSLRVAQAKLMKEDSPKLEMAQTNGAHIALQDTSSMSKATTFFRDGHMARNDGNSVDLDVETTEMSKNSMMFNAIVGAMKKQGMIFRSVIDSSAKIQ